MRLATITNWAYGATVLLTLAGGATMLLAADAQREERAAVEQRHRLDTVSAALGREILTASELARDYAVGGDPQDLAMFRDETARAERIERNVAHITDLGATHEELRALREAVGWSERLLVEQREAVAARMAGDGAGAVERLFGARYERALDRAEQLIGQFQYRLDERTDLSVREAGRWAEYWRRTAEAVLALTGLLFLGVLYFVFKKRVLTPVVRLSDVVNRLAAQDYRAEPPDYDQIDEIGDMAQALRVFRETGLERQRLEAERDRDRAIRDLLSRMTQRMQGCDTLDELTAVVRRFAPDIAPELAGELFLRDETSRAMVSAVRWNGPRGTSADFPSLACWALKRGLPHRPVGGVIDMPCAHIVQQDGEAVRDTLCLPLVAQQEMLGLLYFEPAGGAALSELSAVYLDMLAETVALAIANLRLREALRAQALIDPLTGLANRRRLEAELRRDGERAAPPEGTLACLMIDVDHFKRFNDDHGHDAGDAVLMAVGRCLAANARRNDLAVRYGGEEFLMLLPGLEAAEAERCAERLRREVAALPLSHEGRQLPSITLSIGVAVTTAATASEGLIRRADAALLQAKADGRNRVRLGRSDAADLTASAATG
ncbi:diguanylate cyclase (GGDEF) domain-containing protein [Sphingomonas jatrophae]|uniref:diguanylate cyclase n=2 Tax=Sphingomonas jatrophae TaxID=1166337 RepID=A0A1I6JCR4_9SPHN|nr:diguanylate cyclase [Sphingomonas jatrophae]SFR76737.1 diguanylate cyclase (GGDEF) domain-containing protein [Sphingomonas jatrophae]